MKDRVKMCINQKDWMNPPGFTTNLYRLSGELEGIWGPIAIRVGEVVKDAAEWLLYNFKTTALACDGLISAADDNKS